MITLETGKIYTVSDADNIIEEEIKTGKCYKSKHLNYYNLICAFDIETTNYISEDETYIDSYLYNYIKGVTLKTRDVKGTFRGFTVSNKKGTPLDDYYKELCEVFPGIFSGTYDPYLQLQEIQEALDCNTPNEDNQKVSIMYCWQFAINGRVIFGRTWAEFLELIKKLERYTDNNNRILVYIHNLAFEFQFLRCLFKWHKVFSVNTRKPLYAVTDTGIEFRCSLLLTNYALSKLSEQLHTYKISKLDSLDYDKARHCKTPMTWDEIRYCINDVLVVSAYIQEQLKPLGQEANIAQIPLTATGYCRRYCRKMCLYGYSKKNRNKQFNAYRALMQSLTIKDSDEYNQLHRAFNGGFTHASALWSGITLDVSKYGLIKSIDFTSSYPYVMLSELYPMSSARIVEPKNKQEFEKYLHDYCCVFEAEFRDITPNFTNENYISTSHCYIKEGYQTNNGRLVQAKRICTTITNVDYEIIKRVYSFKKLVVKNMRIYRKGYLPKKLLLAIIKLYKDKTQLKDVEGKEQEYQNAKALLNAVYGMCATQISKDAIIYEDTWTSEPADIEKDIEKYNNSPKRFLFYAWAPFVTAYSRRNLWLGITHFGDDYIYSDTDSIKCINLDKHMDFVNAYNRNCEKKLKKMCEVMDIDYNELLPRTIEGKLKPLGVWDMDGTYDCFKTLGAKRYMVKEGDKYKLTVAGLNKKVAMNYLLEKYKDNVFNKFTSGLKIPKGKTGKLTHVYIDSFQSGTITDYNGITYEYKDQPPGVYLEPASYDFDITQDYLEFIKGVQFTK